MLKYMHQCTPVSLVGLSEASVTLIERLAVHDRPGVLERAAGH